MPPSWGPQRSLIEGLQAPGPHSTPGTSWGQALGWNLCTQHALHTPPVHPGILPQVSQHALGVLVRLAARACRAQQRVSYISHRYVPLAPTSTTSRVCGGVPAMGGGYMHNSGHRTALYEMYRINVNTVDNADKVQHIWIWPTHFHLHTIHACVTNTQIHTSKRSLCESKKWSATLITAWATEQYSTLILLPDGQYSNQTYMKKQCACIHSLFYTEAQVRDSMKKSQNRSLLQW